MWHLPLSTWYHCDLCKCLNSASTMILLRPGAQWVLSWTSGYGGHWQLVTLVWRRRNGNDRSEEDEQTSYRHTQALSFQFFTQHCFDDLTINKEKGEIEVDETLMCAFLWVADLVLGAVHFWGPIMRNTHLILGNNNAREGDNENARCSLHSQEAHRLTTETHTYTA